MERDEHGIWHDIDESRYSVQTACPTCGRVVSGTIPGESLAGMTRRDDGVYIEEDECWNCAITRESLRRYVVGR